MHELKGLQPDRVWAYFEEILAIPRISKKEEKILHYLEDFARRHHLDSRKDQTGNLLIFKPATPGMEDRKGIILQSHVDMVGEKHGGVTHDFDRDPIEAYTGEGWVKARGTTLGADDGIGIAVTLAILESDRIAHGPLECLFTVDEESGMTGAKGLQPGFMNGTVLLNLDSEDEGEFFIGCAGGIDTMATYRFKTKRVNRGHMAAAVKVTGLRGGHSGDEIHKGFGNSIKILNRFLWNANKRFRIGLAGLEGGKARNAIPREAEAQITFAAGQTELIRVYFESFVQSVTEEIKEVEPEFRMSFEETELPETVMRRRHQHSLLNAIYACPHGVIAMSREIGELVETSTNLASVRQPAVDRIEILTSQRSSVESAKQDIADRMASLFCLLGASVNHSGGYPGWKPRRSSEILQVAEKAYRDLFGVAPEVKAIHAGLECGLFLQKYPDLDMISIGPTIKGAHTPEERLRIDTVEKFWKHLLLVLESVPANTH